VKNLPGTYIFFKTAINPKEVLEILEKIAQPFEPS